MQDRLESWKDIASYFKRDVRTIQRWEKSLGLPIHRFQNSRSGPVFAYKSELDSWLNERTEQFDAILAGKETSKSSGSPRPQEIIAASRLVASELPVTCPEVARSEVADEKPALDAATTPAVEHASVFGLSPRLRKTALAVFILQAVLLSLLLWTKRGSSSYLELPLLDGRPLTAAPGQEIAPALSPDGQWVAYIWKQNPRTFGQICVQRANGRERMTLAHADSHTQSLTWSPESQRIAFSRTDGEGIAIYSISRNGGSPKQEVRHLQNAGNPGIDWSPDGRLFAFSSALPGDSAFAVYVFDSSTSQSRKLTNPPARSGGDGQPRFSPDGKTLSFKRMEARGNEDIFLVPVAGGAERRIVHSARQIDGQSWMPDGRALIVSAALEGMFSALWQIPLDQPLKPRRFTDGTVAAIAPSVARLGSQLAWVVQEEDSNIWETNTHGDGIPKKLIESTLPDEDPSFSPSGLVAFQSSRSGSSEIWIAKANGESPVQVTDFNGPLTENPRWSPDGSQLAFDSLLHGNADIFVAKCDPLSLHCSTPAPLTPASSNEFNPSWSSDGKFVYFSSDQSGSWQIWKQPVSGGPLLQITHAGGIAAVESNDGRWIYFSKERGGDIWRMAGPTASTKSEIANEELLIRRESPKFDSSWALSADEIYFVDSTIASPQEETASIRAFNLTSKSTRPILVAKEHFLKPGVSVSPDRQSLLYVQIDSQQSNIFVANLSLRP